MERRFEIGKAYYANAMIKGQPQLIVVPIGREGPAIQFSVVGDLGDGKVEVFDGRECASFTTGIGDYFVASTCEAAACEAAKVRSVIKGSRHGA